MISFLIKEFKTIFLFFFCLFITYWLIFVLTPKLDIFIDYKSKVDSLDALIIDIQKSQNLLNNKLDSINEDISNVDKDLDNIKEQKTIIREIYHEKINDVVNFSQPEIDSFFTNRYK